MILPYKVNSNQPIRPLKSDRYQQSTIKNDSKREEKRDGYKLTYQSFLNVTRIDHKFVQANLAINLNKWIARLKLKEIVSILAESNKPIDVFRIGILKIHSLKVRVTNFGPKFD